MDIRKLQRAIVDGLEDVKAQNVVVFNTEALSPLFERVIIASGSSNRQTKALASSVRETVKSRGMEVLRMEGEQNGEWIIVDCGAAVAHIMQPSIRDYYHLEEIWGAKPVAMKRAAKSTGLVKASEPAPAPAPARKAAAKAPARKAPSKAPAKAAGSTAVKTAARTGAKTAAKSVAKAPSRATASRAPSSTVVVARKTPARKAAKPAAKAPARKAPARKTGSTKG
jgi:ribosome-associated protein